MVAGIASGLSAQLGMVAEVTYNTPVTVTRFLEFNSESLAQTVVNLESRGLGTGAFLKTGHTKNYARNHTGQIVLDYKSKGFGLLLKHCMGVYANSLVAGSERKALINPDLSTRLQGLSLTIQIGRPSIDGTIQPFTYSGCKVLDWELKIATDGNLILTVTIFAATVTTGTALAAAAYQAGDEIASHNEFGATINAGGVNLKSFAIKGVNALDVGRRMIGNVQKEPLANAEATITGTLDFEFEDLTRFAAWQAGTETANLIITWTSTSGNIAGGGPNKLLITCPLIQYRGITPMAGGPGIIMNSAPFKALYDGSTFPIQLEQHTLDTTA